jgi:hypothetical protein
MVNRTCEIHAAEAIPRLRLNTLFSYDIGKPLGFVGHPLPGSFFLLPDTARTCRGLSRFTGP